MSSEKKTMLVLGVAMLFLIIGGVAMWGKEHPSKITLRHLDTLEMAVKSYAQEEGKLPETLAELSVDPAVLLDHVGGAIQYSVNEGRVELLSFGADLKPGGTFMKRDYSVEFDVEL